MRQGTAALGGAAILLSLVSLAAANAPSVVQVPLSVKDCSIYPGYDAAADTAGPWFFAADSTGNSSVDGNFDAVTYQLTQKPSYTGRFTIEQDNEVAHAVVQCTNGTLEVLVGFYNVSCTGTSSSNCSLVDTNKSGWVPVGVSTDNHSLIFGPQSASASTPVVPYAHIIDGVIQPGIYIGGPASVGSTWAFAAAIDTFNDAVWTLRIPTTASPVAKGEFTGFLKINVS